MSPVVVVLVPWDVAICVVTIVYQNAGISMSGLGVNHSVTVGDCAITGGEGDCDSNVCDCAGTGGGEAAEQVSCNADINV